MARPRPSSRRRPAAGSRGATPRARPCAGGRRPGSGWAGCGHLVGTAEEAASVPEGRHLGVVVQSTFPGAHLPPILAALEARALSVEVHDTRCPVVTMRQRDSGRLVEEADVIVVVGGRSSANTRALA